ncbi:MAG: hypothetical protein JXQ75_10210 [Phycisphaerae bacterium]|nr:hypothetical protein [Phycisphaerae bacterium]
MSQPLPTVLISDADVLIDYVAADIGVLRIMATSLWDLRVALPVLREVNALTVEKARRVGLHICEPTLEEFAESAVRGGPLSAGDKLCLAIARRRGWGCLTNDTSLRRMCEAAGIRPVWGLEAMVLLHASGHLPRLRAVRTANRIHDLNPRHITEEIIARFLQQLDS